MDGPWYRNCPGQTFTVELRDEADFKRLLRLARRAGMELPPRQPGLTVLTIDLAENEMNQLRALARVTRQSPEAALQMLVRDTIENDYDRLRAHMLSQGVVLPPGG